VLKKHVFSLWLRVVRIGPADLANWKRPLPEERFDSGTEELGARRSILQSSQEASGAFRGCYVSHASTTQKNRRQTIRASKAIRLKGRSRFQFPSKGLFLANLEDVFQFRKVCCPNSLRPETIMKHLVLEAPGIK